MRDNLDVELRILVDRNGFPVDEDLAAVHVVPAATLIGDLYFRMLLPSETERVLERRMSMYVFMSCGVIFCVELYFCYFLYCSDLRYILGCFSQHLGLLLFVLVLLLLLIIRSPVITFECVGTDSFRLLGIKPSHIRMPLSQYSMEYDLDARQIVAVHHLEDGPLRFTAYNPSGISITPRISSVFDTVTQVYTQVLYFWRPFESF